VTASRTALFAGSLLVAFALGAVAQPGAEARRGKQIYLRGTGSPPGEISARMEDGNEVPATLLPCLSCHGRDGEGRPEGGVSPSEIAWDRLTKPYGVRHEGGRSHPPYTESTLARAIADGIDPAGNELQIAMPRYKMSRGEMGDLIAFLKQLGHESEPGVEDGRLTLGMFVPDAGRYAEIGETMRSVLSAQIERVNGEGGLYGRKLELRVLRPRGGAAALQGAGVFALVAGVAGSPGIDLAALAEEHQIPLVAPVVTDPEPGVPPGRFVFYLYPGLREQALALVSFATRSLPEGRVRAVVFHPDTPRDSALAALLEQRGRESGWGAVARFAYTAGRPEGARLAADARRSGANSVFFLGSGPDLKSFLSEAARAALSPAVFVGSAGAGRELLELPRDFGGRVFVAFPTLPVPRASDAGRAFYQLAGSLKLAPRREAFQLWAYSAGRILIEALRSAGRSLDREKLITALEGLYDFDAGAPGPIRFGPDRRIGASGAAIVEVDVKARRLVPLRDWVGVDF
jgi:ABC-type branched-subunit amino acid transport system substrate-binding protein